MQSGPMPTDGQPESGRVQRWFTDKGYGFIQPDAGGPTVFFHAKELTEQGNKDTIQDGDQVSFVRLWNAMRGQHQAVQVRPAGSSGSDLSVTGDGMTEHGKVQRWFPDKGFGFITPKGTDGNSNIYFHITSLITRDVLPAEGDDVTFHRVFSRGRQQYQAMEISLLKSATANANPEDAYNIPGEQQQEQPQEQQQEPQQQDQSQEPPPFDYGGDHDAVGGGIEAAADPTDADHNGDEGPAAKRMRPDTDDGGMGSQELGHEEAADADQQASVDQVDAGVGSTAEVHEDAEAAGTQETLVAPDGGEDTGDTHGAGEEDAQQTAANGEVA
eukprot:gnl/TRDRNA2_/TRDRNA2_173794_c0_seq9.p1 gnl/TRDRNA2_/TRDRNA2_173794_c0~~gnl/TRDRNA2_/TRDRNA2_173794_c0_seq9.p1  ORF type:complete len:328 (+),score=91.74 gnl/TRDRNA2_/TRDRNA2_173794_c0_seq9:142-1125(+)